MANCSFCERPANEVQRLIESSRAPGRFLCNKCIEGSFQALGKEKQATPSNKKEDRPVPRPQEILNYLDQYVVAQTQAKRRAAIAIYHHYKRREAIKAGLMQDKGVEIEKSNILMLGPSGTGKTQIARTIARLLDVPFFVADATKLTQAGYVGDDVESLLQGLLAACSNDVERAEWGIIFLDEIDKIARKSGRNATGYRDVTGEGVQQALLKMIEGCKMPVPRGVGMRSGWTTQNDMIDTTNILFICAGSFAGIEDQIRERQNKNVRLGFGSQDRKDLSLREIYSQATADDVLDFGMIPELVGRLPVLTSTLPLTEDEMLRVLTEPKDSVLRQYQALLGLDGIQLDFDLEVLRWISQEAGKRPTGARALRSIIEELLEPYAFDAPTWALEKGLRGIRITQEVAQKKSEALLTYETVSTA